MSKFSNMCKALSSPKALSLYSMAGVFITAYFVRKAALKEKEIKDDMLMYETNDELVKEKRKELAKTYAPALVTGAVTIFCINKTRLSTLKAINSVNYAYQLSEDRWNRYKGLAGSAIAAKVIEDIPDKPIEGEKKWFYDEYSQRYFQATDYDILYAKYHWNRNFSMRQSTSVNEFYAFINNPDLPELPELNSCGYTLDEFLISGLEPWIDVSVTPGSRDGKDVMIISFAWSPGFYDYQVAWGYR